ncbi:hypothetical protein H9P43_008031 [Blastocladiella emersonii ATCC 22665]|nr:hypothetical protein H9P43_008031 [Blastocladiella emersonii ATCC 22665]
MTSPGPFQSRVPASVRSWIPGLGGQSDASADVPDAATAPLAPPPPPVDATTTEPPFTHLEHPASGHASTLRTALNTLSGWYWPADAKAAHDAEQRLLARIPRDDPAWRLRLGFIDVAEDPTATGHHLINTLIIESTAAAPRDTSNDDENAAPVVLLHGYGAGLAMWYRNLPALASALVPRGYTLYALDWLGMARSGRVPLPKAVAGEPAASPNALAPPPSVAAAEDYFVNSLERWRAHVGIEKMVLVGHSMGGYLSSAYALRYPHRVAKLVLVSPVGVPERPASEGGPSAPPPATTGSEPLPDSDTSAEGTKSAAESGNPRKFPLPYMALRSSLAKLWESGYTPFSLMRAAGPFGLRMTEWYTTRRFTLPDDEKADLRDYLFHANNAGTPAGEYALSALLRFGAWARSPLEHRLPALWSSPDAARRVPVRFMYGNQDWMDPRAAARMLRQNGGIDALRASVHIVPNAGHQLFLDNSEDFNRCLIDILRTNDRVAHPTVGRLDEEAMAAYLVAKNLN